MKCSIISGISLERAARLGTSIGKTLSRKSKSSLNSFFLTNSFRSLCVAQIILTFSLTSELLPTRVIIEFSSTRRSFVCRSNGISPISSRKSVPFWACSNFPTDDFTAPVKAPFSKPKSSASISSLGIAAQFIVTNLPLRRLSSWSASATSSFPEPEGPYIITGASEGATSTIIFLSCTAASDCPKILLSICVNNYLPLMA